MTEGERRRELKRAGIAAAREARGVLAEAIAMLDAPSPPPAPLFAARLSGAVGTLFRAEVEDTEGVRDRLTEAAFTVGRVLEDLHSAQAQTWLDRVGPIIARSLAILHPARAELDREIRRAGSTRPPSTALKARAGPPANADRRTSPRVRIDCEVGFHTGSHFLAGRGGDVSTGGLFIAGEPLAIGTEVTVGLVLPDGHRMIVDGVVIWARGPHEGAEGMGIRFTRIAPEDIAAIDRYLRRAQG